MSARSELKRVTRGPRRSPRLKRPDDYPADPELVAAANYAIGVLTTVPQEAIKVTAHHGWLFLDGSVHWQHQRTIVEDVIRNLPGVRGVSDSIVIEGPLQ